MIATILLTLISAAAPAETPIQPSTSLPNQPPAPANATVQQPVILPTPTELPVQNSVEPVVNCNTHIAAGTTEIKDSFLTQWAQQAIIRSFSFNPENIQAQLDTLKSCYTEQGWKGFNDAIQSSGNLDAINTQKLAVSSQSEGPATISSEKGGQWKIALPIQVTYQNQAEKVTQHLNIDLLVGRKPNGDLGIMQLIATAKDLGQIPQPAPAQPLATPTQPATLPDQPAEVSAPNTTQTH